MTKIIRNIQTKKGGGIVPDDGSGHYDFGIGVKQRNKQNQNDDLP